jgi:sterol desaturase/sphingolipid hydroxylase (fatty acid hydroxylase superfamily)
MDIKKFNLCLGINSIFSLGGFTTYIIKQNYIPFAIIGINMTRNLLVSYSIHNLVIDRPRILNKTFDKNKYPFNNMITDMLMVSIFDLLPMYYSNYFDETNIYKNMLLFIPTVFIFEIVFDFFHYWTHRIFHHKKLYWIHKKHHRHTYDINAYASFSHHPIDYLFTNSIPLILTSYIIPISEINFMIFMFFKTYIEISGHTGIHIKASSFPECMWLPRLFGIELYAEDHYEHHTHYNKNFSKRFNLWDKIFGTFHKNLNIMKNRKEILDEEINDNHNIKTYLCGLTILGLPIAIYYGINYYY